MKQCFKLLATGALIMVMAGGAFANGLSLNSVGAKSLGMGGAFVGLANDGTAIYWNPAGLIGQKSSVSFYMTDIIPFAMYKTSEGVPAQFALEMETVTNHYVGPNFFAVYNMDDLSLGLGAYVPAGLGAEWDKEKLSGFETLSKIGVFNIAPTIAYRISDQFYIGLAANIAWGSMEMKRESGGEQYTEDPTGWGFGATLGLKLAASEQLDFGLTVRTPSKISFEGDAMTGELPMTVKRDIEWPWWFGFGIAYHVDDCWVITADGQYSQWSSLETLDTEYSFTHPIAGPQIMTEKTDLKWEDAIQIRVGTAYQMSDYFTLRGGYYYDPAPAPDETLNILFPSSTNHVITTGGTILTDSWNVDFGLEYLFGAERDVPATEENEMPGLHQMDIFAFSVGVGYAF